MRAQPIRISGTDLIAGDIKQVLSGKGQTAKRTSCGPGQSYIHMLTKRTGKVRHGQLLLSSGLAGLYRLSNSTGSRQPDLVNMRSNMRQSSTQLPQSKRLTDDIRMQGNATDERLSGGLLQHLIKVINNHVGK